MDQVRWLIRFALILLVAVAVALLRGTAQALVVEGGASVNTTSAGFNSIFYNVGQVGSSSSVYLGDGWAITAAHVYVPLPTAAATFQLPNGTSASYQVINQIGLPGDPDLQLIQLAQAPPLPSIFQNITTTTPQPGSVVALVGAGFNNGGSAYWNNASANSSGVVNLGTPTITAAGGTPNPIPSDTYWNNAIYGTGSTVAPGTYQDAGFAWGGSGRIQWGESVVTFNNITIDDEYGNSTTFGTTFYNSTYDPPSSSFWGSKLSTVNSEVAAIGPNMAQVAEYDSGGGVFSNSGSGWNLSGIIIDQADVGADRQPPNATPLNAAYGDLSFAVDLSLYATSIQSIINSTATWTGSTSNAWDNSTANWSNAANNGATSFASNGNAKFADTNPRFKIALNPSSSLPTGTPPLVGIQSVVVQSAGVSANTITFTNTGSANGGVDYVFSDASGSTAGISGTVAMTFTGNGSVGGSVYLAGANSFTGRVQVFVGQLILQNAFALGSSVNDTISSGAAMGLQTTSGTATTFGADSSGSGTVSLALAGSGIAGAGALNSISGINTYAGPITLESATTISSWSTASNDQLTLTGGINTSGDTLTITGPGNTTISTGVVAGGGTLAKTGSGTLTLSFLPAGSQTSNLVASATGLSLGGGTVAIDGGNVASTSYSQQFNALTINSGASSVQLNAGSDPLLLSINGAISRNVGGTVDFSLPSGASSTTNGITTTATNQAVSILGGWATVEMSDWATISGGQIVALSSVANYTNDTWASGNNTTVTLATNPVSGATTNSLRFNQSTSATLHLTGTNIITSGGILVTANVGANGDLITGGTLEGAAGADLVVIQNNSSAGLTISSTIADNGTATGLTKSGSGALTLTASNSYSGVTTLNSGTLNINSSTALGTGTSVINGGTIDNTSGNNSIITTNAETWAGSFAFNGTNALGQSTGAITLTTSPTITINNGGNNGILTIGGAISGSFGLTLAGSGILALNGANTFSGGITINGGTLRVGNAGALNSTTPNTVCFGSTSSGILNLNGDSVSVGGLSSTSTAATVQAAGSLPSTLTITGVGNYAFAGNLANGGSGALSVIKSGTGTQILSGNDSYTGTTTINSGILEFSSDAALPAMPASITVNSGATVADGTTLEPTPGLSQTLLGHVAGSSTGTIALAANSSNILDFSATGANLPSVSLGSTGNYTYSGTLTPYGTNYNLGGGGGLLNFNGLLSGENSLIVLNGGDVAPIAANTYTGGTIIDSGTTLLVSSDGAAGSAAELGLVPMSATTNITINGGTLQATSTFTLNANRGISLGPSGGTIDVDGVTNSAANTLTYNGVITGAGSLTLTDTGTLVLGGVSGYSGSTNISSGTLRTGVADAIPEKSAVALGLGGTLQLNGFSQTIGSLTGGGVVTDNSSQAATLTVGNDNTSPAAFYGVISDTTASTTGMLALIKVGSGTLTLTGLNTYSGGTTVNGGELIVDTAPNLAKNSQLVVNAGTLQFNATSGAASVQSGVTATIAPAATLQLAGTVSALSDGSAINPTDGQLVNITNNGSTASGGGLSVTGTNQSVGTISGTVTSSQGAATYSGDTVVGAGASLTATQILQNTLTIGAGATVTIRPSGSGISTNDASVAATSDAESTSAAPIYGTALEVQEIQNRIAVLEQLEATDSGSSADPLDETPSTLTGSSSGVPNPANADLTSDAETSAFASEIANLQNRENLLLAEENSSSESVELAGGLSSTDLPAGGVGVPEPSGLLLTLIGAIATGFFTAKTRRSQRKNFAVRASSR